jgi:hypothetical protein
VFLIYTIKSLPWWNKINFKHLVEFRISNGWENDKTNTVEVEADIHYTGFSYFASFLLLWNGMLLHYRRCQHVGSQRVCVCMGAWMYIHCRLQRRYWNVMQFTSHQATERYLNPDRFLFHFVQLLTKGSRNAVAWVRSQKVRSHIKHPQNTSDICRLKSSLT